MILPSGATVANTRRLQYTAYQTSSSGSGSYKDITPEVAWDVADSQIATISNAADSQGRLQAANEGATTVSATFMDRKATTSVKVTGAILVALAMASQSEKPLPVGGQQFFSAVAFYSDMMKIDVTKSSLWRSANESIATVSNGPHTRGVVTGRAPGMTTIFANFSEADAKLPVSVVGSGKPPK
jgi:hypothetical protein